MRRVNFSEFSDSEIQKMLFYFGSWSKLQKYFDLSVEEVSLLQKRGFKASVQYLKDISDPERTSLLLEFGSLVEISKYFHVSVSFLNSLYKPRRSAELELVEENIRVLNTDTEIPLSLIKNELERFGSISLYAYINGLSSSSLRKILISKGIHLSGAAVYQGKNENSKGRKAELFYKSIRGSQILKDYNEEESHVSSADFKDAEFGLVNVKSSRRFSYKAKTRSKDKFYWNFSIAGYGNVGWFYCVCYDSKHEEVLHHFFVENIFKDLVHPLHFKKTFFITEKQIKANIKEEYRDTSILNVNFFKSIILKGG